MKVKYNHQLPFAHRFISHMDEVQAGELVRKSNLARQARSSHNRDQYRYSNRKSEPKDIPFTPTETKILTEFNPNRQSYHRNEGLVETRFAEIDVNKKKTKQSDILSSERKEPRDNAENLLKAFQSE